MRIAFTSIIILLTFTAKAQTVYISTLDTLLCKGTASQLELTTSGTFGAANIFDIQLSDANGSFSSPTIVASFAAQTWTPGSAGAFYIPLSLPTSGKYRMRVVANDPVYVSAPYPFDLRIDPIPPTPVVSNNSPVCVGDALNLAVTNQAGTDVDYYFSGPGLIGDVKASSVSFTSATFGVNGLYNVWVRPDSNAACVASTTTTAVVKQRGETPFAALDSLAVCEGELASFGAATTFMTPIVWSGPGGFSHSGDTVKIPNINKSDSGLYFAYGDNQGCLSETPDTVKLIVVAKPGLKVVANTPLCEGDTLIASALDTLGNLTSFFWEGPGGLNSPFAGFIVNSIKPDKAGKYHVRASHSGCIARDTLDVVVFARPALPIINTNAIVCEGQTIVFSSVSIASPFLNYQWTGPNSFSADSLKISIPDAQETAEGSYILKVTMEEGCSISDTLDVEVKPTPDVTAASNSPVGEDAAIELTATSDITAATYQWTGPNGFISNEQNPKRNTAILRDSGDYVVIATYDGCSDTSSVRVKVTEGARYTLFEMHPNPTDGEFFLTGRVLKEQKIDIGIYHATTGARFFEGSATTIGKNVNHKIILPGGIPHGVYIIKIKADGESHALKFVLMR
jgi:hypothetical protein